MPQMLSCSSGEIGYATATLSATFDHTGNLTAAGFYLWVPDGDPLRLEAVPLADEIRYRCSDLKPETTYQYAAFCCNGQDEIVFDTQRFTTLRQPYDPVLWRRVLDGFDADRDGEMSEAELAGIKEIDFSDLPLASQSGLERLTQLENLHMGANGLRRIDLSANKKLLTFTGGRDAGWEEIYLDNPELLLLYFIGDAGLRTLDLSRCPRLYICQWYGIPLESVDLSQNLDLYTVRINGTKLTELDLSANFRLRHLESSDNPSLKVIWLKAGITLENCEVEPHTEIIYK